MSGQRLLLTGFGMTALLVVVAVASHAHRPGGGTSGGGAKVPPVLLEYLGVIALVTIVLGGALLVFAMADNRRKKVLAGQTGWRRSMAGLAFGFAAVLVALLLTRNVQRNLGDRPRGAVGPTGVVHLQPGTRTGARRALPPQRPESSWLGAVVLGSMLLGLVAAFGSAALYRRKHASAMDAEAALAAALDAVLADTLEDLYAEHDPRAAVIAAYARMEQTFAAYRVPRQEAETPLEYVARVLDSLRVSSWAVRRLTLLFERAKFSSHEVDTAMKQEAIATLAAVRAELEAGDHEAVA